MPVVFFQNLGNIFHLQVFNTVIFCSFNRVFPINTKDLSEANDWWDKVLKKVDDNAKKEGTYGRGKPKNPSHGLTALEYMLEQEDVLNRLQGVASTTVDPDCVTDENGELLDPADY